MIDLDPNQASVAAVVATVTTTEREQVAALLLARAVRAVGLPCTIDARPVKLGKKISLAARTKDGNTRPYARRHAFYVLVIGPDEAERGTVSVRDLQERTTTETTVDGAVEILARELLPGVPASAPFSVAYR